MEAYPRPELGTSWAVRAAAGEPRSAIRVRNLQGVIQTGHDAWGRRDKLQPVMVSAEISLSEPFATAMSTDTVSSDTVHYGTLSKSILGCLEECSASHPARAHSDSSPPRPSTLRHVLDLICLRLTGSGPDGGNASSHSEATGPRPLLEAKKIRYLSVSAFLPKASLLGEGIGLTIAQLLRPAGNVSPGAAPEMWSVSLQLRNLRVPTLIGVNSNERVTKQVVVVSVEIDRFDLNLDVYTSLEALVVKCLDESSFETLEALGAHLAHKILKDFRPVPADTYSGYPDWQVTITMEKPTAVILAEAAIVEVRVSGDDEAAASSLSG